MSGKRAWSPPRSRRPSTAAETSGWPPSCRPELGGDLSAGAAPVSRRVHDSGCRRSAKEIGTEWLPVSHNGAAPGSVAASAGRVRWPSGWAPPAIDGRWKLTTDSPLAKGASTSGRPCGSSVPDTMSTRLPAIRWQRAKDAGRHAGTRLVSDVPCTILVRPGHGRQNRGAHVTQDLLLVWALSRPPILQGQGGPGVGQVHAAPRCPLEGRLL